MIFEPAFNKVEQLKFIKPPYFNNPNLKAQKGILTLWQLSKTTDDKSPIDRTPLDKLVIEAIEKKEIKDVQNEPIFIKLLFRNDLKFEILYELDKFYYNAARLFPGYKGIVNYMFDKKQ